MDSLDIGQKIREVREYRRLTQSELGQMVGMRQSSIAIIESGEHPMNIDTLIKLCNALGCEIEISRSY
jgi:HTH-type transcriptional regulator/antitoxin HipB